MTPSAPPATTVPETPWSLLPPQVDLTPSPPRPAPSGWLRKIHWRAAVGALMLGGILHVGATLAVPLLGPGRAYQKLADLLPANTMVVMSPAQPGKELLPFLLPDAYYGLCRYSLANEPISVKTPLSDVGWTLSLHTPQGENFYVMPGQQRSSDISLVIVPGAERSSDLIPAANRRAAVATEDQIASPSEEGLIIIRAPLKGVAWRAEIETALSRAKCTPGPTP